MIGMLNLPEAQIAFVDTPGLHHGPSRALNRAMNRTAAAALGDADLVVFVVEALSGPTRTSWRCERVARVRAAGASPSVNKIDRVQPRERLLPYLARAGQRATLSSHRAGLGAEGRQSRASCAGTIAAHLPLGPRAVSGRTAHRPQPSVPHRRD